MNADALEDLGFRSLYNGRLWVRVSARDGMARGTAIILSPNGGRFVGRASYPLEKARQLVGMLCRKIVKCGRGTPSEVGAAVDEKTRAQKLLAALLASDLNAVSQEISIVGAHLLDVEDEDGIGLTKGQKRRRARRAKRKVRQGERKVKRQARRKAFRKGIQKLAGKVAKNKVLVKLRQGWANILDGPVGDAAGKVLGQVLQIYGVPPKVTEAAFNVHTKALASRNRAGGWAGVVERTADKGIKSTLRAGGKRWGQAAREGLKESGKEALQQMQGQMKGALSVGYGAAAVASAQDQIAWARSLGVEGHMPAGGVGYQSVYQIGACV